jgi:RNA polymerase sigma-70 factor (ECF subfamily)
MSPETAYQRYFPLIVHHARRLLGETSLAQDVAQETFVRFLKTSVTGGDAGVVAWLYRTSANLAIDVIRSRRTAASVEILRPGVAPESLEAGVQLRSTIRRLAQHVTGEALQAGFLTRANGLTQAEVASVLDVSERTVRRWLTAFDEAAQSLAVEHVP